MLSRAQSWIGNTIHFSQEQSDAYPDVDGRRYRPDCSGYVSMAWHLDRRPGSTWDHSTETLPGVAHQIAKEELQPGDIMLRRGGETAHVTLFNGWRDSSHATYNVLEQGSAQVAVWEPGVDYPHAAIYEYESATRSGFQPWRYNNIIEGAPPVTDAQDTVTTARDFTGDGRADIGAQYPSGELRAWASTGDLSADDRLFGGTNARAGTGWTTGNVQRIT